MNEVPNSSNVRRLPQLLTERFVVLVLADTAFGTNEFVTSVRRLKHHLLAEIQRLQPLAKRYGLNINVTCCKM